VFLAKDTFAGCDQRTEQQFGFFDPPEAQENPAQRIFGGEGGEMVLTERRPEDVD
jgi:hypothetical protein